jgi:phosphoribosyl 1,2-cyclic phosphodiesterase
VMKFATGRHAFDENYKGVSRRRWVVLLFWRRRPAHEGNRSVSRSWSTSEAARCWRSYGAVDDKVHRFQASLFPVNAYLVETPSSVIAIDATLGVSDGRALGASAEALDKPLAGVIVTHSHPDHYGGIGPLLGGRAVPVYAVEGVDRIIRRDEPAKEQSRRLST